MQDLWILVIHLADTVAAVLADDREIAFLDEGLNRVTDVAEARAGTHLRNALPHGFPARFGEALGGRRRLADVIHAARVAVITIADHGDVDVDDVARLEDLLVRDAMANDVIHGRADGLRKAA